MIPHLISMFHLIMVDEYATWSIRSRQGKYIHNRKSYKLYLLDKWLHLYLHLLFCNILFIFVLGIQVELRNIATKKEYVFYCNRWLATDEDDNQILRELPATGEGIKKPLPGQY